MTSISEAQYASWRVSDEHGWHNPRLRDGVVRDASAAERLCLIHSEISEALEEIRDGVDPKEIYYRYDVEVNHEKIKGLSPDQVFAITGSFPDLLGLTPKPEGIGIELADALIRILDLAECLEIDLEECVSIKQAFNEGRTWLHGGRTL